MATSNRLCKFSGYRRVPLQEGTQSYRKFGPFFYNSAAVELCREGKTRARCWNPQATHSEMHRLIAANPTPCSCGGSHKERFREALDVVMKRHSALFASLKD